MIPLYLDQDQETPWEPKAPNVVKIRPSVLDYPPPSHKKGLANFLEQAIENLEASRDVRVDGVVAVIFTENGEYSLSWNCRSEKIPSSAMLGIAARAIISGLS